MSVIKGQALTKAALVLREGSKPASQRAEGQLQAKVHRWAFLYQFLGAVIQQQHHVPHGLLPMSWKGIREASCSSTA